jgi:hypothetical protein
MFTNTPNQKKMLIDETKYILTEQDKSDIMKGKFRWESKLYDGVRDFVKYNG